jgi:hypothetical protein
MNGRSLDLTSQMATINVVKRPKIGSLYIPDIFAFLLHYHILDKGKTYTSLRGYKYMNLMYL